MPTAAASPRSSFPVAHDGHAIASAILAKHTRRRLPLSVSQWADAHRILSRKGSGEPGQWRTDRTPFAREIMDALSLTSQVQRVVLKFAAQIAKTEIALNFIGYIMEHDPAPALVVLPTEQVRDRWVVQRLDPMLNDSPSLAAIFGQKRQKDTANTKEMKNFPGGILVCGGANSPASLASMPIQYVICDEVDRFPWEAGIEGDPLGLVEERTNTFPRRKILLVSTPTTAGLSRIEDEYAASDQRRYEVPCPHCGTLQPLVWTQTTAAGETRSLSRQPVTGKVTYTCAHCRQPIEERHKPQMLAFGRWVPRFPERTVRGYHLSGLYSPIGLGLSWEEILRKWDAAHRDPIKLKRFVNTTLGEVWVEQGDSIEPSLLMSRAEYYPAQLPALLRVAGVDVQKNRLECSIYDFGVGEEAWAREHAIIEGDTAHEEVWEALAKTLTRARVDYAGIDTGHNSGLVFQFAATRHWVFPVKGTGRPEDTIVEDPLKRQRRLAYRRYRGEAPFLVGTHQAKNVLFNRLKMPEPGPGYIHFPVDPLFDLEFFSQVCGEKLVTRVRGNVAYGEWIKTRTRNEALDCLVYALAAARLSGRDLSRQAPETPEATDRRVRAWFTP